MNWAVWSCLLVVVVSATALAISYYLHWSFQYTRPLFGMVAEAAWFVLLLAIGATALAQLLTHMPA